MNEAIKQIIETLKTLAATLTIEHEARTGGMTGEIEAVQRGITCDEMIKAGILDIDRRVEILAKYWEACNARKVEPPTLEEAALAFAHAFAAWHDHAVHLPDDEMIDAAHALVAALGYQINETDGKHEVVRL